MEKIRCQICGKPGSRVNLICGACMSESISKTNARIGKRTLEAIEELDAALEIMEQAGAEPEEKELLEKVKN